MTRRLVAERWMDAEYHRRVQQRLADQQRDVIQVRLQEREGAGAVLGDMITRGGCGTR